MKNDTIYKGNLEIKNTEDAKRYGHLTEITGDLYIYGSAKLDAPKLESVGGDLRIEEKGQLIANKLYTGGYSKFKIYDGIGCVVISTKQKGGVTILACRGSRIKNQKVIGDKFYIAQSDGQNAHGKSIEDALREIKFKTGDRDVSEFRNMPKDSKKSPSECAFVYRMVTGACQFGTERFIESQDKLKKIYTLSEIIKITDGQYGYDTFRKVVINQ